MPAGEPGFDADWLAIADNLARLVRELDAAPGVTEIAETALAHAVIAIGATHAGLVVGHPESPITGVSTADELVEPELSGPLVEAFTKRSVVRIDDTTTETRWPAWQQVVTRLGIRTAVHVPLVTAQASVGVLSIYHSESTAFSDDAISIAELIGRHTAIALATARTKATLTEAVEARRLVGQAMGILMERHQLDDEQAFAVLRRYSQDTNTKLHDVAARLIETGQLD